MVWGVSEFHISDLHYGLRSAGVSNLWSPLGLRSVRVSYLWSPLWSEECQSFISLIFTMVWGVPEFQISDLSLVWGVPKFQISDLHCGLRSARVSDLWSPLWSEECQSIRSLISAMASRVPKFPISDLHCGLRSARVSDLWSPLWSEECQSFRSLISAMA